MDVPGGKKDNNNFTSGERHLNSKEENKETGTYIPCNCEQFPSSDGIVPYKLLSERALK